MLKVSYSGVKILDKLEFLAELKKRCLFLILRKEMRLFFIIVSIWKRLAQKMRQSL